MKNNQTWMRAAFKVMLLSSACLASCSERPNEQPSTLASAMVHLESRLAEATVTGSDLPESVPDAIEWLFAESQSGWKPALWGFTDRQLTQRNTASTAPATVKHAEQVLRVSLTEENRDSDDDLIGAVFVEVPQLRPEDWAHIEVEARVPQGLSGWILPGLNLDDPGLPGQVQARHRGTRMLADGNIHTYQLGAQPIIGAFDGTWRQLVLAFVINGRTDETVPTEIDILAVRIIPRLAPFAEERFGIRSVGDWQRLDDGSTAPDRSSIFNHVPGRISFPLGVPAGAQLHFGLGLLLANEPVTFKVSIAAGPGSRETLFEQSLAEAGRWSQQSIDLSSFVGQTVRLDLEAQGEANVAFWANPTISGKRRGDRPNVILYVIDSAGADHMSVYGYPRRTTPQLEQIAAEGALFMRAHSNSSWTRPSTASFMSSLHHSSMGGFRNAFNVVPEEVRTISQHLHDAGYLTAELTSNPNAGRMSGLNRGVDYFRDAGVDRSSTSSIDLARDFWRWREEYPAEPYFVRIQPTDVHWPHDPAVPFSGLFIDSERRKELEAWKEKLEEAGDWPEAFDEVGVDRRAYAAGYRDLYDEDMAHVDHQIGKLVAELKSRGEWERTVLIVTSDHGPAAGSQDWQLMMREDMPSAFDFTHRGAPMYRSGISRVPLLVVWPGRIEAGQRHPDPVSLIDILPTILDLVKLPMPAVMQGQSLKPLLMGTGQWQWRPVILDEFNSDLETGELDGRIEIIDRRWAASLEIDIESVAPTWWNPQKPEQGRSTPLLLHDLVDDPMAIFPLNDAHEARVIDYTDQLGWQYEAHRLLSQQFSELSEETLTPEQLETLRSLGYIQ